MASSVLKLIVEAGGSETNVVCVDMGGVTGPNACLVSVVSTSPGFVVVAWGTVHVRAVGTVVSGAVVEEIISENSLASSLSVCCSGRCCEVAPMVGPSACVESCIEWVYIAFCSGVLLLVGLLVNTVYLIELLVGE